jgi:hypothetical protein
VDGVNRLDDLLSFLPPLAITLGMVAVILLAGLLR